MDHSFDATSPDMKYSTYQQEAELTSDFKIPITKDIRRNTFRQSTTSPGFYVGKTKVGHPPGFIKGYNFQNKAADFTDNISEVKKPETECEEFESFMAKFGNYSKCYD
jgi:hypothetical protein